VREARGSEGAGLHGCISASAPHLRGRIDASVLTRFLPLAWTLKTRPWIKMRSWGKRGCVRTSGRWTRTSGQNGCPDGKFYHRTSVLTSLVLIR
jgi:hypothetical protein